MSSRLRFASIIAVLGLSLAACAPSVETDQARLCRIALPALWPEALRFTGIRQTAFADRRGLRIDFQTEPPTAIPPFIECRFKAAGRPRKAEDLTGVVTPQGALAQPRLFFLQRFWMATPEGRAADPLPLGDISALPELPLSLAYFLQQLLNGLPLAAVYGLVATSYALIYGLVGRINLAFGAFVAAGGYTVALAAALLQGEWPLGLLGLGALFAATTAAAWGRIASRLVFEPLHGATGQQNLVATVGLALAMSEFLRLTEGAHLAWVSPAFNQPAAFARGGDFLVTQTPIALIACGGALAVALALAALMRRSRFGRDWRALSDDALGAALCGLDAAQVTRASFALACGLAGLAGAVMTFTYGGVGYASGLGIGLKALVAAVLGGIGSIEGALIGGVLVGLGEALWSGYFQADYRDVALFATLALLLMLRPGGLFGIADPAQSFASHLNRRI